MELISKNNKGEIIRCEYDKNDIEQINKFNDDVKNVIKSLPIQTNMLILDMHNVADIPGFINQDLRSMFPGYSIAILSFVGKKSKTRTDVTNEIARLITDGKIDFGMLSFYRGQNKKVDTFTDFGGKAYAIKQICDNMTGGENSKTLFLDDSSDHLFSTSHIFEINGAMLREQFSIKIVLDSGELSIMLYNYVPSNDETDLTRLNDAINDLING